MPDIKSEVLEYMKTRLKFYNEYLGNPEKVDSMSESMYYEIVAVRDELRHLLDYASKVSVVVKGEEL